jgi:hypothetical protein
VTAPEPTAPAAPLLGEERLAERMAATLQARLSWPQAEACARDLLPLVAALVAEQRKAEREQTIEDVAVMVEHCACCGAPSICGARCQDGEEADAVTRAAKPIVSMIRTWRIADAVARGAS